MVRIVIGEAHCCGLASVRALSMCQKEKELWDHFVLLSDQLKKTKIMFFSVVEHGPFLLQTFHISSPSSVYMASLNLGANSLTNESCVVLGSSLQLSFINKRVRRVAEKWRFRVQQVSGMEHMTKQELARSAKRSKALRQILKQYGISEESRQENKTSSRFDDLDFKEKQDAAVPSSVIDDSEMNTEDVSDLNHHNGKEKHDAVPSVIIDSKMNTTEELPGLGGQEKYCETVSTTEDVSGQNHHRFPHLKTGSLFTSSLLPVLGFCMLCIIGTLHAIISRSRHHDSSKRARWRTALSERNEPVASDEHDTSPEYTVSSAYPEATNEVDEACSKVEREYKRFLLECGLNED